MTRPSAWVAPPAPAYSAARRVALALVVLALAAGGAYAAWRAGLIGPTPAVQADELTRVVLVAAAPDEDGAIVAQVIALVDLAGASPSVAAVSPATEVSIPGTAYTSLADAYPFGGGAGVAEAYARATGGQTPAYLSVGPEALARAVDAAGGVTLTLPADMAVFDGETLYTFSSGERTFSADELGAVFKGAPYVSAAERAALDAELTRAFTRLCASWPEGGLMSALERADIGTSMSPDASRRLVETLALIP